ncbi:hypothetical protein [Roseiflexus sp. RS-1]|uniref:hypothetical protein n=1 Tax=Roseiflexus sp. (strain RS-1) TaxID=357808 RepID=UPI0012EEA984|nr:hypothetical protein [Roseiflexus sp. RS-1]
MRLEPGRLRRRRARADHRVTRTLTMTLSAIGYRLSAIGYWLWYRASRPPEMRRDALSQSGGHGAGVFKENDRPVPGLP